MHPVSIILFWTNAWSNNLIGYSRNSRIRYDTCVQKLSTSLIYRKEQKQRI